MKSNSNIKPATFVPVGDGTYFYNYNIVQVNKQVEDAERTEYDYEQVRISAIDDNVIKAAIIAEKYLIGQEINILNNYRRYELKLTTNISFKYEYINYLKVIDEIKDMVDVDVANYYENGTVQ